MSFSIAVGSDQSAYLINATGEVLWLFPNLDCARKACQDWYATPEVVMLQPSPTYPNTSGNASKLENSPTA